MLPTSGTLYTFDVAAALVAAGAPLVAPAPAPVVEAAAPAAPTWSPGTLLLVDNERDTVEPLGTDDEDEAEIVLNALNGPGGTRYGIDVA